MQNGTRSAANPEGEQTRGLVYTLDASLGVTESLSVRLAMPFLHLLYETNSDSGSEGGIGDLSATARYRLTLGDPAAPLNIGLGLGFYAPTGTSFGADLPSNPNFVSGTFDPIALADISYEWAFGLGLYASASTRQVLYATDGFRAGSSVNYGGGLRYRLAQGTVAGLGVTTLHRAADTQEVDASDPHAHHTSETEGSGGTWLYLTPSLSHLFLKGPLAGVGLTLLGQVPLYQNLHGTQLAEDFSVLAGVSVGFQLY